jgi:cell division transport system ATP-binding protein
MLRLHPCPGKARSSAGTGVILSGGSSDKRSKGRLAGRECRKANLAGSDRFEFQVARHERNRLKMDLPAKVSSEDGSRLQHPASSLSRTHGESSWADSELPAPGDALLKLDRVTKVFNSNVVALDDISFQMARGEFLLLVGPNQAGKTTLLKLIASEERPTEGTIFFDRFDSGNMKSDEIPLLRRKMGRIFPDFRLIEELNVLDNVALPLRILSRREKRIQARVREALQMVGMLRLGRRFPPGLSSAEKQKAAVARALAGSPLLLLADEPTMNLDEESADEILALLRDINLLGTAVLLATRPSRLCDDIPSIPSRTLRMEKGRLLRVGS